MRLALALLWLAVAAPAAALAEALEWTALDEAVRDAVSAGDLPGAVVLVGQDDRVLYRKAFGSRAVTPAVEHMTLETVFDIASLTKVVATTPAVLALWEQGKIDLDAPLGRYLRVRGARVSLSDDPAHPDPQRWLPRSAVAESHALGHAPGGAAPGP